MNVDRFHRAKYSQKKNTGHLGCANNVHVHLRALDSGLATELCSRCANPWPLPTILDK